MNPRFYFATCQTGAEKAVKSEILDEYPHLKFAFSRPGFITFKEEDDRKPLLKESKGIFIRLWGQSIAQSKDAGTWAQVLESVPAQSIIHLFERDLYVPGDEPDGFQPNAKIQALKAALPEDVQKKFRWNAAPQLNDTVFDLVWLDDFHVFLGKHIHLEHLETVPGNKLEIALPTNAPSRAYLKIEEAIQRFQPKIEKGMKVLEVGCSPGGATVAMLSRGFEVTGVDPKFMDRQLSNEQNFRFIQKIAKVVTADDLKNINPNWIVMDMNIAPLEAIDELSHVIQTLRKVWKQSLHLQRGFLTIKLNDWKFATSIPLYLKRLHECGFRDMTALQLASNRQEFLVYARNFQ